MRYFAIIIIGIFAFVTVALSTSAAQEADERSRFISFVEDQISSPNMQIRLNGIQGTLSSDVSFESITLSDPDGVWLTISEPRLIWSRSSLLRGRLEIERLTAARIDFPRRPLPTETPVTAETSTFSLPELPVAINLAELNVPLITFGEPVFGLAAEASIAGSIVLEDGSLETQMDINRLDGSRGAFIANVSYEKEAQELDLNIRLNEPENGIVANVLNLEGRPPVALTIQGAAPIDDLRVDLTFDVAAKRILNGNLRLNRTELGLRATSNFGGPLSSILPAQYASLLGEASRIDTSALFADDGTISIDDINIHSGAVSLSGDAKVLADGFLSALNLDVRLEDPAQNSIVLPGSGSANSINDARLTVDYDAAANSAFTSRLDINQLTSETLSIDQATLLLNGNIANFNNASNRSISFTTTGQISGIEAQDEGIADALGNALAISGEGIWSAEMPLNISAFDIDGQNFALRLTGELASMIFDGQIGVEASRLNVFSGLADRALSGSLGLVATGRIEPLSGAFDLALNASASGLKINNATADRLLTGTTNLSGGIQRNEQGLAFDRFRVTNNQADIVLNGRYSSQMSALTARADLRNIGDISEAGAGAVNLDVSLTGDAQSQALEAQVAMPTGQLSGKAVEDLLASFSGTIDEANLSGVLNASGNIDRQPVTLEGTIARANNALSIKNLIASVDESKITADLIRDNSSGILQGNASIQSSDISSLAALALVEAAGGLNAQFELTDIGGAQSLTIRATANGLSYKDNTIGSAELDAKISDLFGQPQINAAIEGGDILAAGVAIESIDGTVENSGQSTQFDLTARLTQNDALITTAGTFVQADDSQRISLNILDLKSSLGDARLSAPTTILIRDGNARLANARLNVAGGSVTIDGSAGQQIDLRVALAQFPLSFANNFQPDLNLAGVLNGTIQASGTAAQPNAQFSASIESFSARQISDASISPVSVQASGQFDGATRNVQLSRLAIANAQDIAVSGSGLIALGAGSLDFTAEGSAPLSIAERFVAERGASISGRARFNIRATGQLTNPNLNGLISVADGSVTDPLSNLQLNNIGVLAGITGDQINVQRLNANIASGGSISGSGSIGINGDLPANLSVALNGARYSDGSTFVTTMDGALRLGGNLARDPLLSGDINLRETEIAVPETFGDSADLLEVVHVSPDPATAQTLQRLKGVTPIPVPKARPSILQLEIRINAPARIFVRGRGLDAELGGSMSVRGPVTNVVPSGRFELRRGRLELLGQRFDLDEGSIILLGDLDPILNFTVSTQSGDVTAFINLTGRASDLKVTFSSSPELPQDEVLARIIFDRGIGELSPAQIARLASVAVELTGGNSPALVDGLRDGLGLDDLDVVQDSDGNAAVRAGKYIADNVYLGVQAGQETEATINLDITESLTARGSLDDNGDTSLGIFFEKDY